jgi:ABC-2 type transport system permease protein
MTYGLFWQGLAALVNLWNRGSAANALILAGAWLAFVIVIPSLINSASALLYPIPPRAELIIADRDAEPNVERDGQRVLSRFYEDHPELRPAATEAEVGVFRRMLLTVYLANLRSYEPLAQSYDIQLQRRQAFVDRLRFLTPAAAIHEPLSDLAGAGFIRYSRFRAQVNEFIERQREFFVPKVMRNAKMTVADYDALPVFRYEDESPAETGRRVMKNLAVLIIWAGLCASAAAVKLRGYSVAGPA